MRNTIVLWKDLLAQGLEDDCWTWDWTTLGVLPEQTAFPTAKGKAGARASKVLRIQAQIIAKSDGIWAGETLNGALNQLALELGFNADQAMSAVSKAVDGTLLKKGLVVSEWTGPARAVLALERPFLNLAAYASGIATAAHQLTALVKKACRNALPG